MDDLAKLIEELERAECGSFDLDRRIWAWLSDGVAILDLPPAYTVNVDRALELVPEGWGWQVSNRAPKPLAGRAYIHNNELINVGGGLTPNPRYAGQEVMARTPALALCIAALKARAALQATEAERG